MDSHYLTKEELRSAQYTMLQEIHKTCTEKGLTYYLAYGTLIGAVRHHGFIPWDDDVDIMMPVDEYEKLRSLYSSDRYYITDCFHDIRHQLCFPRMYDLNTCRDNKLDTLGVFVDIYLIHGAPDNQIERARHAIRLMKLKKNRSTFMRFRGMLSRHVFPTLWKQNQSTISSWLCRRQYTTLRKYNFNNSNIVYAYGGDGLTEFFWKDYFSKHILLPFNGGQFFAPEHYHDVLSTTYGDYMKLPPEEQRHPYHGSNSFCWK